MEKDITCTDFYKSLSQKLLQLSFQFPSDKSDSLNSNLQTSRKQFMDAYVLNVIIGAVLYEKSSFEILTKEQKKILENLRQAFTYLKLKSNLCSLSSVINHEGDEKKTCPEESLVLLNVNVERLSKRIQILISKKHREYLKEKIEEWLRIQSIKVISFVYSRDEFSKPKEGMSAIVDHVKHLKSSLEENKLNIVKQRKYNNQLLKLIFKQFLEYGTTLELLVKKQRTSPYVVSHLKIALFSMEVYLVKFRLLELEVLSSTYTPNSVSCLKKIKSDVEKNHKSIDRSLLKIDQKLQAYEDLDPKFHRLLREYNSLQKDLKLFNDKKM
ncbi:UNVERIFIED_CONTAM: hypothetical protein RMT77_011816 [Armadillidium vulgare]|nr:hypothetical protein Avbf_02421 [Armadillidium vulgare]